ncbi:mannitol dehydrogenase family protein [Marinactinospora rubrisoli]|uniref:Mannitol-1-phosphate 5-dehydrogenase n=1 Tax=Marinactinospora rubrisoli TaxID=2715399 RepID=A0ABW2KF77_9ACTN
MSAAPPAIRLTRAALRAAGRAVPRPPVRIVHIGVGAFTRAHQTWYTAHAADAAHWGIVGFTGRRSGTADRLAAQDGLYMLVERGPAGDRHEVVPNLVAVHPGDRADVLTAALSAPGTAVVTLTITESGYRVRPDGGPDLADPVVRADIDRLRAAAAGPGLAVARPVSALGRLLPGLAARRQAGAPPVAIVPCDNIPANGAFLRRALTGLAAEVAPALAAWVERDVAFVSTSVDRITPRIGEQDVREIAEATGWDDAAPVITEPFADWVLCGDFPAGRPAWETRGARFVGDIAPYEARKLWTLNAAHTLLASLGRLRGHRTVAEAIADPVCRAGVERLWDDAERHLPAGLGIPGYRRALLARFGNRRIEHPLAQIAADELTKLRLRVVPVAERELARGRSAAGCALPVAAWIATVTAGQGSGSQEPPEVARARTAPSPHTALLAALSPDLAADERFRRQVAEALRTLPATPVRNHAPNPDSAEKGTHR